MALKLVLFDVDGTLLDTENIWKQAMDEAGKKFGVFDLGETLFPKIVGKSGKDEEVIYKKELPSDILDDIIKYWRDIGFKRIAENVPQKPGVHEIFEYVKNKGLYIGVGTATNRELTEERLKKIHILDDIDYLICGDEIKNKKPNPDIYLALCRYFNVDTKEALVIEDSVVGVEAAYRASISCIQVPDIIPATNTEREHTLCIVETLNDVIRKIDEIYFK